VAALDAVYIPVYLRKLTADNAIDNSAGQTYAYHQRLPHYVCVNNNLSLRCVERRPQGIFPAP